MIPRILFTGASKRSFLGNHVRDLFDQHKNKFIPIYVGSEYDLTIPQNADAMMQDFTPNIVVHMAAKCGGILANKNSPADFVRDNVRMNLNIIEACHKHQIEYLLTLGSVCMYPKYCPVPFKEDDIFNGKSEETNHPYGESKKLMLTTQNAYRDQYGLKSCMLIPVNMMGEYDHFDLTNSHVIPALINKFVHAKHNNLTKVQVWGTGEATREFLYAGDCAEAILAVVSMKLDTPDPINIGTGKDISIMKLAYVINSLVDFVGDIEFTGEVSDGQPRRKLDVSRAKKMLGFEAKTDLVTGLIKTIKWHCKNNKGK